MTQQNYALAVAQAVLTECTKNLAGTDYQQSKDIDLEVIIASVTRPEPVATLVESKDFEGDSYRRIRAEFNLESKPLGTKFYLEQPARAEPVNAWLLLDAALEMVAAANKYGNAGAVYASAVNKLHRAAWKAAEQPARAEPVNARLLGLVKKARRFVAVYAPMGVLFQELYEAIAAAEQQQAQQGEDHAA